jgi:hypothetical protein
MSHLPFLVFRHQTCIDTPLGEQLTQGALQRRPYTYHGQMRTHMYIYIYNGQMRTIQKRLCPPPSYVYIHICVCTQPSNLIEQFLIKHTRTQTLSQPRLRLPLFVFFLLLLLVSSSSHVTSSSSPERY